MKKLLILLLVIVSALALFAEDVEWYVEDVEGGQKGGTLYLSTTAGPKTMNPYWSQETSSSDIIDQVMDSLLHSDNKGVTNELGMASKYWKEETEDGGVAYYFTIRKGLKWSDGVPITIDDVIFTAEKVCFVPEMTANGNGAYLDDQDRLPTIEKIGDDTVKYTYKSKFRQGNVMLGLMQILPRHIFEEKISDPELFAQTWTVEQIDQVVGSRAFLIKEYKEGVRVVLEANPYFYMKSKDGTRLPYLDKIVYLIVPDLNTERLKFEAGEIDIFSPTPENFPAMKSQSDEKGWTTRVGGPNLGSSFIAFNYNTEDPVKREWFRDSEFRRAIAFAFDKQSVIDNLYNGLGAAMYGPTSESSGFYNPEIETLGYRYSLSKAKRILRDAGYSWNGDKKLVDPKGNIVKFEITTNAGNNTREEIANILVASLEKLGMSVLFRPIQFNTLVDNLFAGKFDGLILGLTGSVDPGSGWNVWRLDGGLHFWNYTADTYEWLEPDQRLVPENEKRIDQIYRLQAVTIDEVELKKLFDEFQYIVARDQILIYTVAQKYLVVYNNEFHPFNPEPSPAAGVLWNSWAIWKNVE